MDIKESIKEIIKPRFGYLNMYTKWINNGDMLLSDVAEFNAYVRTKKHIINKLSKPLIKFDTYYQAMLEISKIEKDEKLKRLFKNGLNGSSRKFFIKTYDNHKRSYAILAKDEFKLRVFFRNSSKPHNLNDYLLHLKKSLTFDNNLDDLIKDIEDNYDYIRTRNGAYLFELTKDLLHIVPNSWCIYESEEDYDREITNRNLHSIWLLVDPCETDDERTIVGIDVPQMGSDLLYMNTLNNRFDDDLPIYPDEFFQITKNRLRNRTTQEDVDKLIADHLKMMKEIEKNKEREREEMMSNKKGSLLDVFFNSTF